MPRRLSHVTVRRRRRRAAHSPAVSPETDLSPLRLQGLSGSDSALESLEHGSDNAPSLSSGSDTPLSLEPLQASRKATRRSSAAASLAHTEAGEAGTRYKEYLARQEGGSGGVAPPPAPPMPAVSPDSPSSRQRDSPASSPVTGEVTEDDLPALDSDDVDLTHVARELSLAPGGGTGRYRPSHASNEDHYDHAIIVRAVFNAQQEARLAAARAQADAIMAASAAFQRRVQGHRTGQSQHVYPELVKPRPLPGGEDTGGQAWTPYRGVLRGDVELETVASDVVGAVAPVLPDSAPGEAPSTQDPVDSASDSDTTSGSDHAGAGGRQHRGEVPAGRLHAPADRTIRTAEHAHRPHRCAEILASLRAAGLEAKRVRSLNRQKWLVKVRAPEERLELEAERVHLRMRRRDGGWSRFKRATRWAFRPVVHFSDAAEGVLEERGHTSLFHSSDRQMLIDHILRSSTREGGADLGENSPLGAYVIAMFPLHMYQRLYELRNDWLFTWRPVRGDGRYDRVGVPRASPRSGATLPSLDTKLVPHRTRSCTGAACSALGVCLHKACFVDEAGDQGTPSASVSRRASAAVQNSGTTSTPVQQPREEPRKRHRGDPCNSFCCCCVTETAGPCRPTADALPLQCCRRNRCCRLACCVLSGVAKAGRSSRRYCTSTLDMPLDRIASYFGEDIAFYFGFMQFYTSWLVAPSVLGALLFAMQVWQGTIDVFFVPVYSLGMALWSIIMLELWAAKNVELAHRWGVLHFEQEEVTRPQFRGTWVQDAVTGEVYRHYPSWKRACVYAVTVPMTGLWMAGAIATMLFVFTTRDALLPDLQGSDTLPLPQDGLNATKPDGGTGLGLPFDMGSMDTLRPLPGHGSWWLAMVAPPLLYGLLIPALDCLFSRLAARMAEWENHRTATAYRHHLIAKVFLFRFTNSFLSLYYYAFSPSHSLLQLAVQQAAFLVAGQLWTTLWEAVYPTCSRRCGDCRFQHALQQAEQSGVTEGKRGRRLLRHAKSVAWAEARLPEYDSFEAWANVLLTFGFVTFFSWAFPLAPALALARSLASLRTNAVNLTYNTRRPIARKASGIGVWLTLLHLMSMLALLTNCAHMALASSVWESYFPALSAPHRMLVVFLLEHAVLALRGVIAYTRSTTPRAVRRRVARDNYFLAQLNKAAHTPGSGAGPWAAL